jgi:predicted RND superfamily exporter protein
MVPVLFSLLGLFTSMALFGFNLDIITSLIAALAVGIGIDYTIHFMNAYKREIENKTENPLRQIYRTTGRAILFNASSVGLGFLALLFSGFIPIQQLGILFPISMFFAALSSLTILPFLLGRIKKSFAGNNINLR